MTKPDTISADYTLRPSELAAPLALLVEARQPAMVWGPPGSAKSMIAQQVAADGGREYVDVRALLLDPVDLRGIPWRDAADRTRWAPPVFLPPTGDTGLWLINLEELPSCVPMVQAALLLRISGVHVEHAPILQAEADPAVLDRHHLGGLAVDEPETGVVAGPADAVVATELDPLLPVNLGPAYTPAALRGLPDRPIPVLSFEHHSAREGSTPSRTPTASLRMETYLQLNPMQTRNQ